MTAWSKTALALAGAAVALGAIGEAPRTVHRDAKGLERATLDVSRAILLEDAPAARKALDELVEHSPALGPDAAGLFGADIYNTDRAFHTTLNNAREYAGRGNLEELFNEFVWIQRSCRRCHELSRPRGLLPRDGPLR